MTIDRQFIVTPVPTSATTRFVENGHAGTGPLPVTDLRDGIAVQWAPTGKALRAMLRRPHVINLVVGRDGSMSMTVQPIELSRAT